MLATYALNMFAVYSTVEYIYISAIKYLVH
jgi:hypothetical protein